MTDEEIKQELLKLEREARRLAELGHVVASETWNLSYEIAKLRNAIGEPPEPSAVLRNIHSLGQPLYDRYPENSWRKKSARSIRAMVVWGENKDIFIGSGDWVANEGPVDIYRLDTSNQYHLDATLTEESVERFWPDPSAALPGLWIAGIDARRQRNSAVHYRKENGWVTCRTIKDTYHLIAMAAVRAEVFVISTRGSDIRLWRSVHLQTWDDIPNCPYGPVELVAFENQLIVFCSTGDIHQIYRYTEGLFRLITNDPFPTEPSARKRCPAALVFNDRVVYRPCFNPPRPDLGSRRNGGKLYVLDPNTGVVSDVYDAPTGWWICDVFVEGDSLYVMSIALANGDPYTATHYSCQIHKSSDLQEWTIVADCVFPAPPFSAVKRGANIYVGVGCRGWKAGGRPNDVSEQDKDSGTVYKLIA